MTQIIETSHSGRMTVPDANHIAKVIEQNDALKCESDEWQGKSRTLRELHVVSGSAAIIADAKRHLLEATAKPLPIADDVVLKPPLIGSRWRDWQDTQRHNILQMETCEEALHYAQSQIPFDHRSANVTLEDIKVQHNILHASFPFFRELLVAIDDNTASIPETLFFYRDRAVSNILWWHVYQFFACKTLIPSPKVVAEIGGGYGALARLWMTYDPAVERYIIIDLPESLFFSETALRAELGDVVGYFNGSDPGTKVLLVPVNCLADYALPNVDLAINVGSMQEMSDTWIEFYMNWLDRNPVKWLYSLNYMGQPIHDMWESRNLWAPRLSQQWTTRAINADVPLIKYTCSGRWFAETVYEKTPAKSRFSSWPVLDGALLTRQTYLEGLELFRQEPTEHNAMALLRAVIAANRSERFWLPKELLAISATLEQRGNTAVKPITKFLYEAMDNFCA